MLWTYKLITAMLIAYSIFSGPYWSASAESLWLQRAGRTQTGKTATHTLLQIPCLIVTLISALHHRCNYTHSFLLTCWGLPPSPAGHGISCSVGMIIVGISNKKRCRVIMCVLHTVPASHSTFTSSFNSQLSLAGLPMQICSELRRYFFFFLNVDRTQLWNDTEWWYVKKKNVFCFDPRCMVVDALNLGRFYSSAATALAVIELPLLLQKFLLSIRFDTSVWGFIQAACGSPLPSFLRGGLDRRLHFSAVANLIPWWRFSISIILKNVSSSPPSTHCAMSCNFVLYVIWTVFPLQFAKYDFLRIVQNTSLM